jgi:hypothetical protein
VRGLVFRRRQGREARAEDVLGSPVVSVEETHHVDAVHIMKTTNRKYRVSQQLR